MHIANMPLLNIHSFNQIEVAGQIINFFRHWLNVNARKGSVAYYTYPKWGVPTFLSSERIIGALPQKFGPSASILKYAWPRGTASVGAWLPPLNIYFFQFFFLYIFFSPEYITKGKIQYRSYLKN